jgi:hypothetical protein
VGLIGFARAATRGDYLVSAGDKPRNKEGADVAGSADDDDSNGRLGWSRVPWTAAEKSSETSLDVGATGADDSVQQRMEPVSF